MSVKAVIISDIHFSLNTLDVASTALLTAFSHAESLGVPLIVAGDLISDKANLRAEVVNSLLGIFHSYKDIVPSFVIIGNHDKINQKGIEHSLNFLGHLTTLVHDHYLFDDNTLLLSYQHDSIAVIECIDKHLAVKHPLKTVILHQGLVGAASGEYFSDISALQVNRLPNITVYISGHYHKSQDISLPNSNTWYFIGNPYTLTFGEHDHPEKGHLLLNQDLSVTRVPHNTRKHVVIDTTVDEVLNNFPKVPSHDLLWLKVRGKESDLMRLKNFKSSHPNTRIETILIKQEVENAPESTQTVDDFQVLTEVIDSMKESQEYKNKLRVLCMELLQK